MSKDTYEISEEAMNNSFELEMISNTIEELEKENAILKNKLIKLEEILKEK